MFQVREPWLVNLFSKTIISVVIDLTMIVHFTSMSLSK